MRRLRTGGDSNIRDFGEMYIAVGQAGVLLWLWWKGGYGVFGVYIS